MSRVIVALLAAVLSANTFSATQTIEASPGYNFVPIELKVGENRLVDLFPTAPAGTLVFTYDNHGGWSAAQMYPFGWSHPDHTIVPWAGAILFLPAETSLNHTLNGEVVPFPRTDFVILPNEPVRVRFFRGFNLVSAKAAKHMSDLRPEPAMIYAFNKATSTYTTHQYDELLGDWSPPFPDDGAIWYRSTSFPSHPDGQKTTIYPAVYFNNYAPAFRIDQKIQDGNCNFLTNGTAQIYSYTNQQPAVALGDPISVSSQYPGYLDPGADHVRYLIADSTYFVRFESGEFTRQTETEAAPPASSGPPMPPQPMWLFRPTVLFRSQPQDASFRPRSTIELHAIFQVANGLVPDLPPLPGPYQWQKQSAAGEWTDVPNATNYTLTIENAQPRDAGKYRLRATTACEEQFYSRTAVVSLISPTVSSSLTSNGTLTLTVQFPVEVSATVQSSTDLELWTDELEIATPTPSWSTNINNQITHKFYRVVERP